MNQDAPLSDIKGIGPKLAEHFSSMGLNTLGDLMMNFPRRYQDYSNVQEISGITPGPVSLSVQVDSVKGRYVRRGMHITEAVVSDKSGSVKVVWFNQPYRANAIKSNKTYFLSGELVYKNRQYQIINPALELKSDLPTHTARVVPIYRESKKLKSHRIRKIIMGLKDEISEVEESLPEQIIQDYGLLGRAKSLGHLHFPQKLKDIEEATYRFGFEELLTLQIASQLNKRNLESHGAPRQPFDARQTKKLVDSLPYKLTNAQRRCAFQILKDLDRKVPMNRLLEGDVGSGKTVVAALAIDQTIKNSYQVALMAPTSILAAQHYQTLKEILPSINTALIHGQLPKKDLDKALDQLKSGQVDLVIGTHALIFDQPIFKKLGLAIIDEQHRFGVNQRAKLLAKNDQMPHLLSMSATPIPRSLALTVYGELDISVIDQMPPGRKPVKTKLFGHSQREQMERSVAKLVQEGRQGYVVVPLIENSEVLSAKNATDEHQRLSKKFKELNVGILHGRLKEDQKQSTLKAFANNDIDLLVATTVIEVGVHVENASIMIIEGAERFGLAQLHQLRGRVGRSDQQAHCFLITSQDVSQPKRLKALEQVNDGFKLAELDLELRGPGAIYGQRQHGALDLRMVKLTDAKLIASTQEAAKEFTKKPKLLLKYPRLNEIVKKQQSLTQLN